MDFLDAAKFAKASLVDNIHMDEENHEKLAMAFRGKIGEMFANDK